MKKILIIGLLFILPFITFADNYNSVMSGLWNTVATWGTTTYPNGTKEDVITIKSGHIVTAGMLNFNKSTTIIIENGAELIIGDSLTIDIDIAATNKDFILKVLDGGKLTINGNFKSAKDANLTIDGDVTINGDLTLGQNATINVDLTNTTGGNLVITGDLTAGSGSTLNGYGSVSVGGNINVPPGFDGSSNQLPIELNYFNCKYINDNVLIEWETLSETNNDFFIIEYSEDAFQWYNLINIKGAGNSSVKNKYNYLHNTKNSFYYRLTQVDYNGEFEVFNVVFVNTPYINDNVKYMIYDINGKFITYDTYINAKIYLDKNIYIFKNNLEIKKIIIF